MSEQPMPKWSAASKTVAPVVDVALGATIDAQRRKGVARYGTALHTFNGRPPHKDLLPELVDAVHYSVQAEMERQEIVRRARGMAKALRQYGPDYGTAAYLALAAWDELGLDME